MKVLRKGRSTKMGISGSRIALIISNPRAIVCVIDDLTLRTYSKRGGGEKTKRREL
jgi:hypothetical protein